MVSSSGTFGATVVTANGGSGGTGSGTGGAGGTGGTFNGGNGANGSFAAYGGGGGGSAGTGSDGTSATNGTGASVVTGGGAGGNGGVYPGGPANGSTGSAPGGGGGGGISASSCTGGNGGNGKVIISWASCTPPAAPSVTSPVNYCLNATASALTATGTSLTWYASDQVTVLPGAPTPVTTSTGSTSYYVSQTIGCESAKAQIVVNVNSLPTASVSGQSNLTCYLSGNGSISVSASPGPASNYMFSIDNGTHYYNTNSNSGTIPPFYIPNASYTHPGAFSGLPSGTYKIRVKDNNGCESKSVQ